jgi:hypothetical protein
MTFGLPFAPAIIGELYRCMEPAPDYRRPPAIAGLPLRSAMSQAANNQHSRGLRQTTATCSGDSNGKPSLP